MRKEVRAMANWNNMTESKFKAVKILLKGGASIKEAAEYMQLSTNTVYLVNSSDDWEEYQTIRAERDSRRKMAIKAKEKKQEEPEPEVKPETKPEEQKVMNPTVIKVEATHYMMEELKKTNELLTAISAKLAAIVTDLYGVK